MSISNSDRVGRGLELLNSGLKPFVVRELETTYGPRWKYEAVNVLQDHHITDDGQDLHLDVQALMLIMWNLWNQVFKKTLGHAERNYVSELRIARNQWAHQELFTTQAAGRILENVSLLLKAISAHEQANEAERQRMDLFRISFEEQARTITRRKSGPLTGSQFPHGLLPWREVITPHPDVASGNFQMAEFAADLSQVRRGVASSEYGDPTAFFARTYLTNGLRELLRGALKRLSGQGGDPVVELQTNFGGGKTHSLLALYHLFSGIPAAELTGVDAVLHELGLQTAPAARRAVLVGYDLSPARAEQKPDGCVVHTIWGEMAWQLLGRQGYAMVEEDDLHGVSPGAEVLRQLFVAAGPVLILIDEWVVFVRQLYEKNNLPAGSFEANLSFAQNLTEAAKAAPKTLVVASIPASNTELGGTGGQEAAIRLRQIFGRIESPWRPADPEEGFEIVRRRLFEPIPPQHYASRDGVARTFSEFYRSQRHDFPSQCSEADYERRIKECYPIHPELFDRLFNDWSSIEKFQRTRGVLRLMASVVHELWTQQDHSLLILPANIPLHTATVQSIFTQYLDDNWVPIIEKDVDGANALPRRIDGNNPNFGRYSAARKVARTIFFSATPTLGSTNKGIQEASIKLGCAQPGETVPTFGDVLHRLTDQATYLYQNDQRYWYGTQPSVTRLAQDRAEQYDEELVYERIKTYLRVEQRQKGDFASVHVCPDSGADVLDDNSGVRLVILKPHYTHVTRDITSTAMEEVKAILNSRGNAPRINRNTLIFLAADRTRIDELKQATRLFMAWESIEQDHEELNLDAFLRKQATTRRADAEERIHALIPETYSMLLFPEQPNPRKPDMINDHRLQAQRGLGNLAARISKWLRDEELLITQFSGIRLRQELDRIPLWRGDFVTVKELTEIFARYIYLPRLKSTDVLIEAIQQGAQSPKWQKETFAYALNWDPEKQNYLGLTMGQSLTVIVNSQSLVVKSDAAYAQWQREEEEKRRREEEERGRQQPDTEGDRETNGPGGGGSTGGKGGGSIAMDPPRIYNPGPPPEKKLRRFVGSIQINERMMGSEAGRVMDEIVRHLTALNGSKVIVTIDIAAEIPDGVPDKTASTIKENGGTMRFDTCEFYEE
ncbi:hypothetical protein KDA_30530 [Dictyobacter alpinus]|uniref:Swt1-like HEPN domain-containing protein n=1 Tax=Dictyobacter alpinus TaxID=2014873 RepID=A0A402B8B8_9CHLR|nr:DUF499 domain-containing protein [Dictyobacter alpinus]GCE27569.1 hypothetical protein KDA_30530 [Dictyobacter alpinus]